MTKNIIGGRSSFGSWRNLRRLENQQQAEKEFAERMVTIIYESATLEEYRKWRPHYATMLERGTAEVRKCLKCDDIFVTPRWKGKICWPCYSGEKDNYPKKLKKIIIKLYKEYVDYINQGVTIKKI